MLHAIPEAESEDHSATGHAILPPPLDSDGSLSEPKSEGFRERSIGADEPHAMERGLAAEHAAHEGVQELLAMVEEERNRMSKAVLNSADGLSSAVTLARKRLAANIAAVEEQLKEERRQLEESKAIKKSLNSMGGPMDPAVSTALSELRDELASKEKALQTWKAEKRAVEEERDLLRSELDSARREVNEAKRRAAQAEEERAGLSAQIATLRTALGEARAANETSSDTAAFKTPARYPAGDQDSTGGAFSTPGAGPRVGSPVDSGLLHDAREGAGLPATAGRDARDEGGGELAIEGILRRKKADHGRFEDPWKQRLHCTLSLSTMLLECVVIQENQRAATTNDRFDLREWYVPAERKVVGSKGKADPLRFDLIHRTEGRVASFKADSAEEGERWFAELRALAAKRPAPSPAVTASAAASVTATPTH